MKTFFGLQHNSRAQGCTELPVSGNIGDSRWALTARIQQCIASSDWVWEVARAQALELYVLWRFRTSFHLGGR